MLHQFVLTRLSESKFRATPFLPKANHLLPPTNKTIFVHVIPASVRLGERETVTEIPSVRVEH